MVDPDPVLDALRAQYRASLPDKWSELEQYWQAVRADTEAERREGLRRLQRRAHKLAGSAGSYGFEAIGAAAEALDDLLESQLDSERPGMDPEPHPELIARFRALTEAMRRASE